jgi:hypothetical protein
VSDPVAFVIEVARERRSAMSTVLKSARDQQEDTNIRLGNAGDSGRPVHDELVPSRYVHRVGEIDVLVISDGVLPIPAPTIAHNVDPAVRGAWLEDMFLSPEMLDWPLNVVLVRSGGRTILVDAGLGRTRT